MINKDLAEEIVKKELSQKFLKEGLNVELLNNETIEESFGWVFFYNTIEYIETGNPSYALIGNSPIIVNREDGSVNYTGTANDIEFYINEYKRRVF